MTEGPPAEAGWFVYVLRSTRREVTYVGIARDVDARLVQHNGESPGGAKSTRAARPWAIARREGPFATRGLAQSVEWFLRQRRGRERLTVELESLRKS